MLFVFKGENKMARFKRLYRIQIICADVPKILSEISLSGVELQTVEWKDPLTVTVNIQFKYLKKAERILTGNHISWKIIGKQGMVWKVEKICKRPVLLIGSLLFLITAMILPNRIFFTEVVGNQNISSKLILMNAEKAGIKFGAPSSEIRSEAVKNAFLQSMPQLQWAGVTTRGCVAVIEVKERSIKRMSDEETGMVSNIVAVCDGVITSQTVYEGNPLYEVGDVVNKGDTIVSGYVDCGIKLRVGQSNAEIYAFTTHKNQYLAPISFANRDRLQGKHTCYKLRLGKKVINLCNHSGIMDACCVKMYSEEYWSLPGGFQLPVSVLSVTHLFYEIRPSRSDDGFPLWLSQFARKYVIDQMVSGRILDEDLQQDILEDVNILTGTYACHEMIGREKYEGIKD